MRLCRQHETCEPIEPGTNVQRLIRRLKLRVVVLTAAVDQERKRGEARLSGPLRQRLFRNGTADSPVAVFERMDGFEVEMREPSACQRRQWRFARWARGIEPAIEPAHLVCNGRGGRRFE